MEFPLLSSDAWSASGATYLAVLQILNKVKFVLYIGKIGSLSPEARPNEWLATGDRSFLNGRLMEWANVLQQSSRTLPRVHDGIHVTVSTSLCETKRGWKSGSRDVGGWTVRLAT